MSSQGAQEPGRVYLVASGDLRLAANQQCWPAQAAGMATSGSLTRWFRDELGRELPEDRAYERLFAAAAGDAFLAGSASGRLDRDDLRRWVRNSATVRPNPGLRELYDRRFEDYLRLYEQTKDIVHRLAR